MRGETIILGAGESGTGAALLAKAKGLDVFVSEKAKIAPSFRDELLKNNIDFEEGKHSEDRILNAEQVIKSPGIPDSVPLIQKLKKKQVPIISDIELACSYSTAHIAGITGSNGKTTTTLWLYHILQLAGLDVKLSGNIGTSPCRALLTSDPDIFVMELSSFQLDTMYKTRINTAIITNITPDHLDRYDYNFDNYIQSKFRILQNQQSSDKFIWCADDPVLQKQTKDIEITAENMPFSLNDKNCAYTQNQHLVFKTSENNIEIPLNQIALKGKHNIYNAMAAGIAALSLGVNHKLISEGIRSFKGAEHRLEFVKSLNGIDYINDSKATNVSSTWYALDSMDKPVVWIAGGTDKGNDYQEIIPLAAQKVKLLICLGKDNTKLKKSFSGIIPELQEAISMEQAVTIAKHAAKNGDVILLSPACASFDLFDNYIQRGKMFKQYIDQIN